MTSHELWHLLQISDQFFPSGAFAFSHAMETYVQLGVVHDRASCHELLSNLSWNALGPCDVVFCAHAFRHAADADLGALGALDQRLSAIKIPRELRLESRHTGQAFLRAALAVTSAPLVQRFFQDVQQGTTPAHHAVVFGLVAQSLDIMEDQALLACLYNITAGFVAAAVRLVPLGQTDGQRLLHDLAPTLIEVMHTYRSLPLDQAWSCTPGLDIRSMQHERLYSRLCRS